MKSTILIFMLMPWTFLSSDSLKFKTLVWSDEFNVDGKPDPAKWTYEYGFMRNKELQWYQPENALVKNGKLVITAKETNRDNPTYNSKSDEWQKKRKTVEYTSACLITQGKQSWKYGRFEIKARIPTGNGVWPAIWTLGTKGEWPSNGEIDIMEYYKGKLLANAFWGTQTRWVPVINSAEKYLKDFHDSKWAERFHVWRMDWDEQSIKLFVDDFLLNEIDLSQTQNATTKYGPKNPFHHSHYLLINLAIGGNAAGPPVGTKFPITYEIDYVRIYQ